jgi:hypothetical protein
MHEIVWHESDNRLDPVHEPPRLNTRSWNDRNRLKKNRYKLIGGSRPRVPGPSGATIPLGSAEEGREASGRSLDR